MHCSETDATRAPPTEPFQMTDHQTPSEAVVLAVAEASGREAAGDDPGGALDPLYHAVDPDALDTLFETDGDAEGVTAVEFVYEGYEVTVEASGVVTLHPIA